MPRAKVDPRFRQRVARACTSCKRRKAKCNGVLPCDQCKTRRVESACCYSTDPQAGSQDVGSGSGAAIRGGEVRLDLGGVGRTSPARLSASTPGKQGDVPVVDSNSASRDPQMVEDGRGKFIYVGESASLSFLETVRSAVHATVGPCAFSEPPRNPMVESTPKLPFEEAKEPVLDYPTARVLVSQYFQAISGILDLFDPPWLKDQIKEWVEQPASRSKTMSALIYSALAIGAQGRANGDVDDILAEQCFAYGRQLTAFHLMNEPSLETIQAFLHITYYMVAANRWNAAFMNLGLAARAAYTLGIHLHETNEAFGGGDGLARERAWKSLRVCDLFLSASLGRPPATSESVSNITMGPIKPLPEGHSSSVAGQVFSAMFRISNLFERILTEVYAEKAVSVELAKSISAQHRQWTEELPQMLMVDGLEDADLLPGSGFSPRSASLSPKHGASIVTMAYYYSIVLLTRPFLTFQVRHASKDSPSPGGSTTKLALVTYADACVNSAIKGIDIAHEYVFELDTPKRQPLVVNSVFISALCLGLAYLDTSRRRKWPMDRSMDLAIKILNHLGQLNNQSAHFAGICSQLKEAATIWATRRDDSLLQKNDQAVREIFGDICPSKSQSTSDSSSQSFESPHRYRNSSSDSVSAAVITPQSFDFSTIQDQSMLPTSGLLPSDIAGIPHGYDQYQSQPAPMAQQRVAGPHVDPYSGNFMEQDVPLFPLTSYVSPESYFNNNHNLC